MQTDKLNTQHDPSLPYIPGLVAVVGCDGTGKSTLTADLVKHLNARWATERRYLGLVSGETGDKIKRWPIIGVWLERRLAKKTSKAQSMSSKGPALWAALIMYGFSLWRMSNLHKVKQLADSGVLVISDRFPQSEITGFYYDGPGIGVERVTGRLKRWLAAREQRLYQREMKKYRPELLIRLDIDVETAFSRKPDHDYEELRDKIGIMSQIQYSGTRIYELDSRMPYAEVLEKALEVVSAVATSSHRNGPLTEAQRAGQEA